MKTIKKLTISKKILFVLPFSLLLNSCDKIEELLDENLDDTSGDLIIEVSNETLDDKIYNITLDGYNNGTILANANEIITSQYCGNLEQAYATNNISVFDQIEPGNHTLKLTDAENDTILIDTEFEMFEFGCYEIPLLIQYLESTNLEGIWILDLTLADSGICDETHLEDETHIPPTFHFNSDETITFDTDPVDSDLNGPNFSNTYTLSNNTLTIRSVYSDINQTDLFEATLTYTNGEFIGTYTNNWFGETCTNSIVVYRQ